MSIAESVIRCVRKIRLPLTCHYRRRPGALAVRNHGIASRCEARDTGINPKLPGIDKTLSYGPENVSNYEFGFKGTFADGRMNSGLTPDWTMTVGIDKTDSSSATLRAPGEQTRDPP